jgi:hypothetical protein
MQLSHALPALAMAAMFGCNSGARLRDQFNMAEYHLPVGAKYRVELSAPIILAGRVKAVNTIGAPTRSPGDHRIKTQLTRITIDVEQEIRGTLSAGPVDFYFFAYALENTRDLGVPRYVPHVGQRRIYFLKQSTEGYRSVGDVTNYNLAVRSGTHARDFCRGKAPGCCIAEILLTPSADCEVEAFVADLGPAAFAAGELCSSQETERLVDRLTRNEDMRIAAAALEISKLPSQWWPGRD